MTTRTVSALFSVALVASAYGCSSSSSSTGTASSAASAVCGLIAQCDPIVLTSLYGSVASCETIATQEYQEGLAMTGVVETAAELAACIDAEVAQGCGAVVGVAPIPAACKPIPGTLAAGTSCISDAQCAGLTCTSGANETCGICATLTTGLADGTACTDSRECTSGFCGGNGSVCAEIVAAGVTCDSTHVCGYKLICSSAGTCVAIGEAGAACTADTDCDSASFGSCDTTTGKCTSLSATYSAIGGACEIQTGSSYSVCSAGADCFNNVCVANVTVGQKCDVSNGPACDVTSTCGTAGVCVSNDTCTPASTTMVAN